MLTSRERVRTLLAGKPADRIPNGLCGTETATLHLLAYDRLKKLLGVSDPWNRMTTFMTTALGEPPVLEALEADIVLLNSNMCAARFWGPGSEREWQDVTFWGQTFHVPRAWHCRTESDGAIWWEETGWKCPAGGIYFDPVPAARDPTETRPVPADYNPPHTIPDEI